VQTRAEMDINRKQEDGEIESEVKGIHDARVEEEQ
jgi:hypothetical protein